MSAATAAHAGVDSGATNTGAAGRSMDKGVDRRSMATLSAGQVAAA